MVNPISIPATTADLASKTGPGVSGGAPVQIDLPSQGTDKPSAAQIEQKVAQKMATAASPLVTGGSSQPLVPPLTSLALWRDGESGMQMSVVRDRVSGQVVEQVPTERARRLAAMIRQQEMVAQELQREQSSEAHIDLKT